jgi:uncharacterized protein (DUF1800 family)
MPLLDTYNQPLDALRAGHLLRRTTFGTSAALVKQFTGMKPLAALQVLLRDMPEPPQPLLSDNGTTFLDKPFNSDLQGRHQQTVKAWWIGLMQSRTDSIVEKLTLFWQNHFVTTFSVINDSRFMQRYLSLLRRNAMGNFRTLVTEISKDPSMLRYLNGNTNVAGSPNENYARELMELFTIGRGNYSEDDVRAASRVLTGWQDLGYRNATTADIGVRFRVAQHDANDKTFSSFFQNTVIKGRRTDTAGDEELADLVTMILKQAETARFIIRKLYRWFVNYDITQQVETEIIEPLAKVFRQNYNIKPILTALLSSVHFNDEEIIGSIIKSPLEMLLGSTKLLGIEVPDQSQMSNLQNAYNVNLYFANQSSILQMNILDQPTVFGWRPYYDTGFYEIWINSTTLSLRNGFTDSTVVGFNTGGRRYAMNSITLAQSTSQPEDPEKLVKELSNLIFAIPLTKEQVDFLIDNVLVAGLPRYEWNGEWYSFAQNPNDNARRMAVKAKLDLLLLFILRMAEFQLC